MRFTDEAAVPNWHVPDVGAHNIEVLQSLGYAAEEIEKILARA
jgi:crotonobetainyl-CoA:carnitine CoA-transferase CaiB-like acyl-CoA transferase